MGCVDRESPDGFQFARQEARSKIRPLPHRSRITGQTTWSLQGAEIAVVAVASDLEAVAHPGRERYPAIADGGRRGDGDDQDEEAPEALSPAEADGRPSLASRAADPGLHRGRERSSLPVRDGWIQIAIGPGQAVPGGGGGDRAGKARNASGDAAQLPGPGAGGGDEGPGHSRHLGARDGADAAALQHRRPDRDAPGKRQDHLARRRPGAMGMGGMEVVRIDPKNVSVRCYPSETAAA